MFIFLWRSSKGRPTRSAMNMKLLYHCSTSGVFAGLEWWR